MVISGRLCNHQPLLKFTAKIFIYCFIKNHKFFQVKSMQKLFFKQAIAVLFITSVAQAQSNDKMDFEKYDPTSTLVVPQHIVTKAKYPFIDVHNHQWGMGSGSLDGLVKDMNDLNMKVMVNLSGSN